MDDRRFGGAWHGARPLQLLMDRSKHPRCYRWALLLGVAILGVPILILAIMAFVIAAVIASFVMLARIGKGRSHFWLPVGFFIASVT